MSMVSGVLFRSSAKGHGLGGALALASARKNRFSVAALNPSVSLRTTRLLGSLENHVISHAARSIAAHSFSGAVLSKAALDARSVWRRSSPAIAAGANTTPSRNPFLNPFGLPSYAMPANPNGPLLGRTMAQNPGLLTAQLAPLSGGAHHGRRSSMARQAVPVAAASAGSAQGGHTRARSSVSIEMPFVVKPLALAVQLNPPPKETGHVRRTSVVIHANAENEEAMMPFDEKSMQRFQVRREVLERELVDEGGVIELCAPSEVEGKLKIRVAQLKSERLNLKSEIMNAQFTMKHAALNGQGKAFIAEKRRLIDLKQKFERVTESLATAHRTLTTYQKLLAAPKEAKFALSEAKRIRDEHMQNGADKSVIKGSRDVVKNKEKAVKVAEVELRNFYAKMHIQVCRKTVFQAELEFLDKQMELDNAKIAPAEVLAFVKVANGNRQKVNADAMADLKKQVTSAQFQLELCRFKRVDLEIERKILKLEETELFAKVEDIYGKWMSLPIDHKIPRAQCEALFAAHWAKYKDHLRARTRVRLDEANLAELQKSHPALYQDILDKAKEAVFQTKIQYAQRLIALCPGFFSAQYLAKTLKRPIEAIRTA